MYPYKELLHTLKIALTPIEYKALGYGYKNKSGKDPRDDIEYLQVLPKYIISRCPLCDTEVTGKIDTYNIFWYGYIYDSPFLLSGPVEDEYPQSRKPPCEHLIGFHPILNLHSLKPTEIKEQDHIDHRVFTFGEVPYITPWFLPEELESYAVLHSLPVCRIVDNEFVPAYTLFIITYFSKEPRKVIDQHLDTEYAKAEDDSEYYPTMILPAPFEESSGYQLPYDLRSWFNRGKLKYLDYRVDTLPVRSDNLPEIYQDISGRKHRFAWRDGKFTKW